ncbi:DUF1848 family protein [bacterium]|nr:DUF1848 family protein [bacterium]
MTVGVTERGDAGLNLHEWIAAANKWDIEFTVAITKAPHILLENIDILPKNLIIHATITGWGGTDLEPNVRNCMQELEAYTQLVKLLGPERVVLRVDPIIPTAEGVQGALTLINNFCKGRLRVSILDYFMHVEDRLVATKNPLATVLTPLYNTNTFLKKELRGEILKLFPTAEICGELGFPSVGCISIKDYNVLVLRPPEKIKKAKQRPSCSCLAEKRELLTHKGQCDHKCLYCYWR